MKALRVFLEENPGVKVQPPHPVLCLVWPISVCMDLMTMYLVGMWSLPEAVCGHPIVCQVL